MAVGARIGKAEGRVGPRLCARPAPCEVVSASEVTLLPDGREERSGPEPPAPCDGCPRRGASLIMHVEVVLDRRGRHGDRAQLAARAATLPPIASDGGEAYGSPEPAGAVHGAPEDDGLPASWPPDHPARLALEGRESPVRPRRRRYNGPEISPEDFGL